MFSLPGSTFFLVASCQFSLDSSIPNTNENEFHGMYGWWVAKIASGVWTHDWSLTSPLKKKMEFRKRLSFWENSHFLGKSPYLQRKLIFQTIIFWGTPLVFQGAKFLTWPLSKLPFLFGEFCKFSKSKLANFNDSGSVIEKFHNLKNKKNTSNCSNCSYPLVN